MFLGVVQPQIHTELLYLGLKGTTHTRHTYNAISSLVWIQNVINHVPGYNAS